MIEMDVGTISLADSALVEAYKIVIKLEQQGMLTI